MSLFFKSKNNQNKYFIYLLISKLKCDSDYNLIETKIIITKHLILHDFNYILNNYDTIIANELEYKIIEHEKYNYTFHEDIFKSIEYPKYPYDIFILNRILLHSLDYFMNNNKSIKEILYKEKINIISNLNYLKRLKDWNANWKKNRYCIEKYQNVNENTESIFSINTLSQYYFNIDFDSNNNIDKYISFKCKPISFEDKSLFERTLERPNTDYIEKCNLYFEEDKHIKFL